LLGYQWLFPGKKLLFMGGELGQRAEWNPNVSLDWFLLDMGPFHAGLQRFVGDLNQVYQREAALWESDYDNVGFYWVDCADHENSVLSFMRQNAGATNLLLVVLNLTPVPRMKYRLGLPRPGFWREVINSDAGIYGGSNLGNLGGVMTEDRRSHHHPHSAVFTLPPLSITVFKHESKAAGRVSGNSCALAFP